MNTKTDVTADAKPVADKQLYRVPEAMSVLSLSRSVIYEQFRSGRLRSVKQGSTRFVTAKALSDYVALLESEASAGYLSEAC